MNSHEGVSCDGCNSTAFSGNRFKCLRCNDYDLCQNCYSIKRFGEQARPESIPHDESHPMQLIMTQQDFEAVYEGDNTKSFETCKIASFTCPYCNLNGLNLRSFGSHVTNRHSDPPPYNVICPVCIATPDLETSNNRDTENLKAHWNDFHSIGSENYRIEPIRGVVRRPMLARRGRQAARPNIPITTATVPQALTPAIFPWIESEMDVDDLVRTFRAMPPAGNINITDNQRQLFQLQSPLGTRDQRALNLPVSNRIAISTLTGQIMSQINEYAQPRLATATTAAPTAHQTHPANPVIRPLRVVPIYPPANDMHDEISADDLAGLDEYTEDDGSDDEHVFNQPTIVEPVRAMGPEKCVDDGVCDSDSEFEMHFASDNDMSSEDDEIDDQGHRMKPLNQPDSYPEKDDVWREVREKLTSDEIEVMLSALRAEPTMIDTDEEVQITLEKEQSQAPMAVKAPRAGQSTDDGEQSWLSLQFEVPSIRSFGTGNYWSDKRFLRQRKLQREQSAVSSALEDLEKGEAALAVCRSSVGSLPNNLRQYDRPDRTLRRALRNVNLATMDLSDDDEDERSEIDQREEILKEANRLFESTPDCVHPSTSSGVQPNFLDPKPEDVVSRASTRSNDGDGVSSENDDDDEANDEENAGDVIFPALPDDDVGPA